MSNVLALVPSRAGSKGIPRKNLRLLAGVSPTIRAVRCAYGAGLKSVYVSCDWEHTDDTTYPMHGYVIRPPELAQDDTPMIDVVRHALTEIPGPPDQIILLVQPTQPLRTPAHLQAAIALLQETQADSVVSVVDVGVRDAILYLDDQGFLNPLIEYFTDEVTRYSVPTRRQGEPRAYRADGTCYAFWRQTVTRWGDFYGQNVRPLMIPAEETCALDTMDDWREAERRLRERAHV